MNCTHLPVEDVSIVMYIVSQQVSLGTHQQCVSCCIGTQSTSCQTAYCLVNIKQGDVGVLATLTQPMSCLPFPSGVRVVDEYLASLTGT